MARLALLAVVSSHGGNMRAMKTGTPYPAGFTQRPSSVYRVENSSSFTLANLVDQFQFAPDDDWNMVYEAFRGHETLTACAHPHPQPSVRQCNCSRRAAAL